MTQLTTMETVQDKVVTSVKLGLDLGGSDARFRFAEGEEGISKIISQHIEISTEARVFETIHDKMSDFLIHEAPHKPIVGRRFARGEAQDFFSGLKAQVDNQSLKVDQDSTYVNASHAMAIHAYNLLQEDPNQELRLTVGVAIPTSEFYSDAVDRVKERLIGKHTIEFKILGRKVEFHVDRAFIFPEGVIALLQMAAGEYGTLLRTKTGLIIDAGRRSTDVTIIREMKPNARSARSLPLGGISLESNVSSELEKAGYMPSPYGITKAIATGTMDHGSTEVPAGQYVQTAKEYLATDINEKLRNVYSSAGISVNELNYIVYLGRCFATEGESNSPEYTGDLGALLMKEINVPLIRIDVENLETANVDAVFNALQRVK